MLIVCGKADIETIETLSWSWQRVTQGFTKGLIYGLKNGLLGLLIGLLGLFFMLINVPVDVLFIGLFFGLSGLIYGLIDGLAFGLIGSAIENKIYPNQGIIRSFWIAALFTIITSSGLFAVLVSLGVKSDAGLINGLGFGLFAGLIGGGGACIKHFSLRLILYLQGHIPWNYARFLNYTTDRLFMQKVGGGYIFVHRMLMEHFAQMKID